MERVNVLLVRQPFGTRLIRIKCGPFMINNNSACFELRSAKHPTCSIYADTFVERSLVNPEPLIPVIESFRLSKGLPVLIKINEYLLGYQFTDQWTVFNDPVIDDLLTQLYHLVDEDVSTVCAEPVAVTIERIRSQLRLIDAKKADKSAA